MHYVIAGGGTGGHIYPAVAIAELLSDSGTVTMLARSGSMEERVFLSQGLDVRTVASAPLLYTPGSLWRLARATRGGVSAARRVMTDSHADAFVGTGGYVSVPGIIAAHMSGVPVYLLEQNTVMGRANRLFSGHARRCVPWVSGRRRLRSTVHRHRKPPATRRLRGAEGVPVQQTTSPRSAVRRGKRWSQLCQRALPADYPRTGQQGARRSSHRGDRNG